MVLQSWEVQAPGSVLTPISDVPWSRQLADTVRRLYGEPQRLPGRAEAVGAGHAGHLPQSGEEGVPSIWAWMFIGRSERREILRVAALHGLVLTRKKGGGNLVDRSGRFTMRATLSGRLTCWGPISVEFGNVGRSEVRGRQPAPWPDQGRRATPRHSRNS